jgi:mercuric ion transport protein
MAQTTPIGATENAGQQLVEDSSRTRLVALGSVLGGLAATSCCVLPLVLFSLGISGAWIANFTALAPHKPYFAAGTLALLGYGYYLVYVKARRACADGSCARPLPNRVVTASLWIAALVFDYIAPLLLS